MSGEASREVQRVIEQLESIGDAGERAIAAGALLKDWPRLHRQVREVRQQAVIVLRQQGMSHADIGRLLGITKARAAQIAEGRLTGRRKPADAPADVADAPADER